jgi:hypothetical protein
MPSHTTFSLLDHSKNGACPPPTDPVKTAIAEAVRDATAFCGTGPDRFVRLEQYTVLLEANALWTEVDLSVFHRQMRWLISYPAEGQAPFTSG